MRLLCVNNKPIPDAKNNPDMLMAIQEGQEYEGEIRKCLRPDYTLGDAWCIPEISTTKGYHLLRFAPLSDLDETELVTEEFEEKYCVPVKS